MTQSLKITIAQYVQRTLLLTVIAVLLFGCGYSTPYSRSKEVESRHGNASIYVDMWGNNTSELGYQTQIKKALVNWIKKSTEFSVSADRNKADYVLQGTIESAHYPGLSFGTWERAVELRAEIVLSYNLRKNGDDKIILKKRNYTEIESFMMGRNSAETEMNKQQALVKIADEIADNIFMQLFYALSKTKN